MDIFKTILAGAVVFAIGQFILKYIIEPVVEFGKIRGEIAHSLLFYANVYTNPGIKESETVIAPTPAWQEYAKRRTAELEPVQLIF